MKPLYRYATGIGFFVFAGSAMASQSSESCSSILSSYSANPSTYSSYPSTYPECFGSSSVASTTSINATAFSQAGAITQALMSRAGRVSQGPVASAESHSGLAAGGTQQSWNVWLGHNINTSSVRVNGGAGRNDSDTNTTIIGGDYAVTPIMTAGISAAFDRSDSSSLAGNQSKNSGYTLAPYLGYQLSKEVALDISAGIGRGEFSTGAANAGADRWFATGNLSYTKWMGNIQFNGRASLLHGEEKYANLTGTANTAATNKLDQLRMGGRASYWMSGVMPYAGLSYTTDVRRSSTLPVAVDPLGRDAFVLSLGADFFSLSSKVSGGIAYEQEYGRRNSKNETFLANINLRF
jgi:hypothetical protein